jgi:tetratricopeptide (TPR) repeat protein
LGRKEEAEKYYLLAIEKGEFNSINDLANLYVNQDRIEEAEKYYLLAIEKGEFNSMNDLANLYVNQDRIEEAKKYLLIAIEKGDNYAKFNLSLLLYLENFDKEKAFSYITQVIASDKKELKTKAFDIIISVWSGKLEKLELATSIIIETLESKNTELINMFIRELLVHHQKNMVWQWFNDEQTGPKLKDIAKPFYYVVARLLNNEETKEELLAMAPEIEETVNSIYDSIIERQKFYYGKK